MQRRGKSPFAVPSSYDLGMFIAFMFLLPWDCLGNRDKHDLIFVEYGCYENQNRTGHLEDTVFLQHCSFHSIYMRDIHFMEKMKSQQSKHAPFKKSSWFALGLNSHSMHFKDAIRGNDEQNCMCKENIIFRNAIETSQELKIKDHTAQVRICSNVISSVHSRSYIRESCFQ